MMKIAWWAAGVALIGGCIGLGRATIDYRDSVDEGFESLFNGKDLTGWEGATNLYGVVEGESVLCCFPERKDTGHGDNLYTVREYENFILRFEFMMSENGNNGLGIRMNKPTEEAAYHAMCELQLLDDCGSEYYDASNKVDRLKPCQYTGSVYGVVPSRRDKGGCGSYMRKPGEWNFEEVKVVGSEIEVSLNGHLITKANVAKFIGDGSDTPDHLPHPGLHNRKGRIGWLGHGCLVKWRNIRIKELPDDAKMCEQSPVFRTPDGFTTCFDGRRELVDANWKGVTAEGNFDNPLVRQEASAERRDVMQMVANMSMRRQWSVCNGSLRADGSRSACAIATKADYEDFEMWADWRTLSDTGAAALCLRGLPLAGVPSGAPPSAVQPTGDWNRLHVILRGNRATAWLNGVPVLDNLEIENPWDRFLPLPQKGQVELQCLGDPVEWRSVFIREL